LRSLLERFDISDHLAIYILVSLSILMLLYEESRLASLAEVQVEILGPALVQQVVMAALFFGILLPVFVWGRKRWLYGLVSIVFAGYSGSKLAAAFSATLGIVPALEAKGIPIFDYQATFYLFALAAAICYLLAILLLRRSYGKLSMAQQYRRFGSMG
jgi:hypothetical protein